jgi:beta-glucosidase
VNPDTKQPGARPDPATTTALFPADFLWGAATASYQVEGSPLADGAGPSIWYRFDKTPGRIANDATGDVACDHYRRYPEDVRWLRELGLGAYRFSIAWGRVLPDGRGGVNRKGLDFYARLVDLLLANDIQPCVTLYHWDLPAALDDRGGWLNPDIAGWFGDYASVVYEALADRVPMWITLNEPWVVTDGGYLYGVHAPGHRSAWEAPRASHQLLRSHVAAVQAYRACGAGGRIGLTVNLEPKDPESDSEADRAAVERSDAYMNRQYLDAVFFGRYPEELAEIFGAAWPKHPASEMESLREPFDFLGINYYTRAVERYDPTAWPLRTSPRIHQPRSTYTETGWEVHPQSFTRVLCWVRERYGDIPLYVTENGAAFYDPPVAANGRVEDPLRVSYYRDHLRALAAARAQGVDVRGYFAWSLRDNLEWTAGYTKRFGLFHVDYETQIRTPKDSALFYREVIASGGANLSTQAG